MTPQCELFAPNHSGPDCPAGALPATARRLFFIIFFPPCLNGSQMKSGGAIGLIIGIRPKLEGAEVHWHTDQQQR